MSRFHVGQSIVIGPHRIVPIEERRVLQGGSGAMAWFFAERRPYALLVCRDGQVRCLDPAGGPMALADVVAQVPALAAHLGEPDGSIGTVAKGGQSVA